MKYSKTSFKNMIINNNFNFKKKFGQNFIADENIINKIVHNSQIDKDTLVIEIGPGAGSLTYYLAKYAKEVLCYEIDTDVKDILENNLKEYNNINIIYNDFLHVNVKNDLANYEYKKLYIISNLPYYITTPIILKIIKDEINVDKMVFMVQKEVGDRFKAKPGTKDYSSLSVYLDYYFDVKKIMDVSRNVFIPVPKVDSIVVEFKRKSDRLCVENRDLFFALVRDSFKFKRKNLKNNLKSYDLDIIDKVLHKNGYNLGSRAEQIPIDVFVEIANSLVKCS